MCYPIRSNVEAVVPTACSKSRLPLRSLNQGDYIVVRSDLPGGDLLSIGIATCQVEFAILTSIADPDRRPAQTRAHSARVGAILDLFTLEQSDETLAALQAPAAPWRGVGFSGFEFTGQTEDGRTEGKQLAARLRYIFEVYLE
jgi:hypothetical protein